MYSLKPRKGVLREFPCSQLEKPYKDFQLDEGLRVNCRIIDQPTAAIRLIVREELEFELSEIEVHSISNIWLN